MLQKEIIFQSDLERLIGKRPFEQKTTYDDFVNGNGTPAEPVADVQEAEIIETEQPESAEEHTTSDKEE